MKNKVPSPRFVPVRGGKKGFTLLEVLIALSVLSISMLGVYSLIQISMDTSIYASDKLFVIERGYDRLSRQIIYPTKAFEDTEVYDNITVKYSFEKTSTPIPSIEEVRMKVSTDKAETEFIYYAQSGQL